MKKLSHNNNIADGLERRAQARAVTGVLWICNKAIRDSIIVRLLALDHWHVAKNG